LIPTILYLPAESPAAVRTLSDVTISRKQCHKFRPVFARGNKKSVIAVAAEAENANLEDDKWSERKEKEKK
jgi:hypothetical protein